jgi:hypothetical protein
VRSRFQFVDDHRDTYEVKRLCQVLDVNRSSYYKWLAGAEARATRQRQDRVLAEEIRAVHGESGGAYGSPRITAELREKGRRVNEKRVARIMRTFSITGIRLRRRVRTTLPDPAASQVPDLFQRDFTATEPGRKYMGDITYLPLAGGEFLYLATVLDCFSRKVVGWSIAEHMRTSLVADALQMAASTRGGLDGAVFHSDHGAVRLEGLRRPLRPARGHPVDGRGRHQCGQCGLREFPRVPQTRDPSGRPRLRRRWYLPPDRLRLADPLQHPPPALRQRPPQPQRIRTPTPNR